MKSTCCVFVFLLGTVLAGIGQAAIIFQDALPNSTNVNNAAGANRSNVDWAGGSAQLGYIVGESFSISNAGVMNSITVYEVANNPVGGSVPTDPTNEFSNITLYYGADASPLTLTSSSYTYALTAYSPAVEFYQGTSGTYYPIYALTFSGLNFALTGGTLYDFAVDATPNAGACATAPGGDPCLLYLAASNAALSGTEQDNASGVFDFFTVSGGTATFAQGCASGDANPADPNYCGQPWDKDSNINFVISGSETPEPSTFTIMAAGLAGVWVGLRRRVRR